MSKITVSFQPTAAGSHWSGDTAYLRIYYYGSRPEAFSFSTGEMWSPSLETFYREVACTIASNVVTIPTTILDSTPDITNRPDVFVKMVLVDSARSEDGAILLCERWDIPIALGSSVTFEQLRIHNKTPVTRFDDRASLSRTAIEGLIEDAVLVGNPATTSAIGRVEIDTEPEDAASPVAVGTNSPRLSVYGLTPQMFGAIGDGTSHPIDAGDIAEHTEWLGTYTAGTEWDTVGVQEALFAAYGDGSPVRWPSSIYLNKPVFIPQGAYLINRTLRLNAVVGFSIRGAGRKAARLFWTGSDPDVAMWSCDGLAYGEMGSFSLEASAANNEALLDIDFSGTYLNQTLKQQQLTFSNIDYVGNAIAATGFRLNFVSTSSGQGDTILISNCSEFNFTSAGAHLLGANVLQVTVLNGDSQNNKYGYWLEGAQAHFIDKHFENGTTAQIDRKGFDVYQSPQALDGTPTVIDNCRSEGGQLAYGVAKIADCQVVAAGSFSAWAASTPYRQGNVIVGGGKAWIQVAPDPETTAYFPVVTPFSQTVVKVSGASFTTNEHAGRTVEVRYPNGFTDTTGVITSNTSDTLTLSPGLPFMPADGVGQTFPTTDVRILLTDFPETDASEPDWEAGGSVLYFPGLDSSSLGVGTEEGSDLVTVGGGFTATAPYIGSKVLITGAGPDGGNLYSEVVAVPGGIFQLADEASVTIGLDAGSGEYGATARIESPTTGGLITDGTALWLHYEFYSLAMLGTRATVENTKLYYGQVWGIAERLTVDDSAFTRNDWLHSQLVGGNFTERRNSPSGLAPLSNVGIGFTQGGVLYGSRTFAQLSDWTDAPDFLEVGCSDGTPGSNPLTGGGSGCKALRIGGAWVGLDLP